MELAQRARNDIAAGCPIEQWPSIEDRRCTTVGTRRAAAFAAAPCQCGNGSQPVVGAVAFSHQKAPTFLGAHGLGLSSPGSSLAKEIAAVRVELGPGCLLEPPLFENPLLSK